MEGTQLITSNDPEIGLYTAMGNRIATDDDSGDGLGCGAVLPRGKRLQHDV
jgi:hypothetical protein